MTEQAFITILSDNNSSTLDVIHSFISTNLNMKDLEGQFAHRLDEMRKYVFQHADGFDADQLSKLIKKNLMSFDILISQAGAKINPNVRSSIQVLLGKTKTSSGQFVGNDEIAWKNLEKKDRFALDDFLTQYPQSKYAGIAREILTGLRTDINVLLKDYVRKGFAVLGITEFIKRGWVSKNLIKEMLSKDLNLLSAYELQTLLQNGMFTIVDINSLGFSEGMMRIFNGHGRMNAPKIPYLGNIGHRVRVSDDYYFWGTSGSGKSCALGAIMSAAANGCVPGCSMTIDYNCQGSNYIEILKSIFSQNGRIGVLPPGTPVGVFAEMGFDLMHGGRKKSITCIDMAGGMLDVLAKKDDALSVSEKEIVKNLSNIMTDAPKKNRCTHVFLLEYKLGDTNKQANKLGNAMKKIQELKILDKTQEILVLVTKVDKMNVPNNQIASKLSAYLKENFVGFYNSLEHIAQKNNINGGHVRVVPFNIGKVEMQTFCTFDADYATRFVKNVFLA